MSTNINFLVEMTEHGKINLLVVVFHLYERNFVTFDILDSLTAARFYNAC